MGVTVAEIEGARKAAIVSEIANVDAEIADLTEALEEFQESSDAYDADTGEYRGFHAGYEYALSDAMTERHHLLALIGETHNG